MRCVAWLAALLLAGCEDERTLAPADGGWPWMATVSADIGVGPHGGFGADARPDGEARPDASAAGPSSVRCLGPTPDQIDFGDVEKGSEVARELRLAGCGAPAVTIESLRLEAGSDFRPEAWPPDGTALAAGETAVLDVRFAPRGLGAQRARIRLVTDASDGPEREVQLRGRGTVGAPPRCVAEARGPDGGWGRHADDSAALAVRLGDRVDLRATGSFDPDGRVVATRWAAWSVPGGSSARLEPSRESREVAFVADREGAYVWELVVVDDDGQDSAAPCRVVVRADWQREPGIRVELSWATTTAAGAPANLDLHLVRAPADWFCQPSDCWSGNPDPDWDKQGDGADDPSLEASVAGAESVRVENPDPTATYRVGVHYAGPEVDGAALPTLRFYADGVRRLELANRRLPGRDGFWDVGRVVAAGRRFELVDTLHPSPPAPNCR